MNQNSIRKRNLQTKRIFRRIIRSHSNRLYRLEILSSVVFVSSLLRAFGAEEISAFEMKRSNASQICFFDAGKLLAREAKPALQIQNLSAFIHLESSNRLMEFLSLRSLSCLIHLESSNRLMDLLSPQKHLKELTGIATAPTVLGK